MSAPAPIELFPSNEPHPAQRRTDAAGLAQRLRRRYADRITGCIEQPARVASWAELPADVPAALRQALGQRGIHRLYSHQAEAWRIAQAGKDLLIATPTASGKTLCYTLPVLSAAITERARALFLFPTKALAQDQLAELLELNRAGDLRIRTHTFDGDTPGDARQAVRLHGDIVISNPDMLHQGILPHHTKWAQLFETLRYVVIDEIHTYRGVFGSHLANVLRRLLRICAFYGSRPQFIMASATIGNPQQHAEALIGRPVQAICNSGAACGQRTVLLWNPPVVNPDLGIRASARSQTTRIARAAIRAGLKTLLFAQSRLAVEVLTKYLKDVFDHDPRKPARIRAYRGGYLPNERRQTEQQMRAGQIDGLVGTSALELGVDIGALDVVVLNGYPGSIASTWQRLGRAGRRQQPALGVLVASSEALDQYLIQHPEDFRDSPPEQARIAENQPLILLDHIRCAAFELPFARNDLFGTVDTEPFLQLLEESGVVHAESQSYEWIADSYPANAVSLRSVADGNFLVIDRSDGRQTIIAEVDYSSAALTLYEGAIHLIQSQPFQVERLDWPGRKAFVTRTHADYYTDAIDYTRLKVLATFAEQGSGSGHCAHGEVHVIRRVAGYKKIRYYSHENIGYGPVTLPDLELHSSAVWWRLPGEQLVAHFASRQHALDAFLGAAHCLHVVATVAVMAEARDLQKSVGSADGAWCVESDQSGRGRWRGADGSLASRAQAATFEPTVYLYDNFPGGIGLSEPLHLRSAEIVQRALDVVERCRCKFGCPACVGPILQAPAQGELTPRQLAQQLLQCLRG